MNWLAAAEEVEWLGVDLDGTLAFYDHWRGPEHIGEPIPKMMDRVKEVLAKGEKVKIMTGRASFPDQIQPIKDWLIKQGLGELEVTNEKDHLMKELWDDRCRQVVTNQGEFVSDVPTKNIT